MDEFNSNISKKSYWEKPEGLTGMIIAAVGVIGGSMLLYKLLPFIITLLENTIYAGILFAVLAGVGYMAMDKRIQNLVSYLYIGFTRQLTKAFIDIDPISILETYVVKLKINLDKMDKQIANLSGQISKLKKNIAVNKSEMEANLKIASKAKEIGKRTEVALKTRKAGRLQNSNMTLETLLKKMELLHTILVKMYENASALVEDTEDTVKVQKQEFNAVKAGHSALKSAMSILRGNTNDKMMFDLANESLAEQMGMKIGEMEHFMKMSESIMNGIDLQNMVFEDDGFKMLEEWENKTESFLLGSDKQFIITSNAEKEVLPVPISKSKSVSRWNDLG